MSYKYSNPGSYASSPSGMSVEELKELVLNMKMDNRDFYDESVDGRVLKRRSVTGDHLEMKSITVDYLDVDTLSAIVADLGTVTAGTLTGVNIYGGRIETLNDVTEAGIVLEGGSLVSSSLVEDAEGALTQKDTVLNQGSISQIELQTTVDEITKAYMSFYEPGKVEIVYEVDGQTYATSIVQNDTESQINTTNPLTVNGVDLVAKVNDFETRLSAIEDILADFEDRITDLENTEPDVVE